MLGSAPLEILEHIAFSAATQSFVGPPSGLPPLLLTCRSIRQALSFEANPYLYARIFSSKFDIRSAFRRLGSHVNAPRVLADELKRRWIHLKAIKMDSRILQHEQTESSPSAIHSLWLAYLMMLENDGKNEQQLLDYAEMDVWLLEYWSRDEGVSLTAGTFSRCVWPVEDEKNSLAMWLFWFLLRPNVILQDMTKLRHMMTVTKMIALAANHYPVSHTSWTDFLPRSEVTTPSNLVTHFSETYRLSPPVVAPAAVLAFLTLALQILLPAQTDYVTEYSFQCPASLSLATRRSEDWDTDWYRCINLGKSDWCTVSSGTHTLGSLEGIWEGVFAYTDFNLYSSLLAGAAPSVLDQCLVAHHRQTWRLREYYLAEDEGLSREESCSLGSGDPLKAYFPLGIQFEEFTDSVRVQAPGRDVVHYWRPSHTKSNGHKVTDIIVLGEGHSAWGQFNMYGRVRLLDGLISFSKEYTEGDRGRWLYRGYLIGNADGHISGRWRDTQSPSNTPGYEGCFVMCRR